MNTEVNSSSDNNEEKARPRTDDLPDTAHDAERMQPEEVTLDLPDVSDIPGQEHIHVPPLGELADTTISSDDEEGLGIFDEEEDDASIIASGTDSNVSDAEKKALERAAEDMPTRDDRSLRRAELDQRDLEGEAIEEGSLATDVSGADLDTAGEDEDDADEAIGEEDEENNAYSLGGDTKTNLEETEE